MKEYVDKRRTLNSSIYSVMKSRPKIEAAEYLKAAGIERESLYRALSPRGNPRLSTLFAVTKAMGLTLTVETSHATHQ